MPLGDVAIQEPNETEFHIEAETLDDGLLTLAVRGDLDIATVPELRRHVDEALEAGAKRLVIDLSEVTFIDSVSLAVIVRTGRTLGDSGRLGLVVPEESYAMLIFKAGGIAELLALFETRDEAIAHARG